MKALAYYPDTGSDEGMLHNILNAEMYVFLLGTKEYFQILYPGSAVNNIQLFRGRPNSQTVGDIIQIDLQLHSENLVGISTETLESLLLSSSGHNAIEILLLFTGADTDWRIPDANIVNVICEPNIGARGHRIYKLEIRGHRLEEVPALMYGSTSALLPPHSPILSARQASATPGKNNTLTTRYRKLP